MGSKDLQPWSGRSNEERDLDDAVAVPKGIQSLNDSVTQSFDGSKCQSVTLDNSLLSADEKKNLAFWGLPSAILVQYARRSIVSMFDWQLECLNNGRVLTGANLVYSAPTSAGKTLVAEILTIKTVVEKQKKAIIILPYVSVVQEKMLYFQELLSSSGIRVQGLMGSRTIAGGFKSVNIAICTIEKANSLVNRLCSDDSLRDVGIVVVDELHLVGDPFRGYILELLLTKIKYMCDNYDDIDIQIVGMSATLPNLQVLADWLDAVLYKTDFRPVPLYEFYKLDRVIYDKDLKELYKIKPQIKIKNDPDDIVHLCLETVFNGHSALIFCPTKQWCESLSTHLSDSIHALGNIEGGVGLALREQFDGPAIARLIAQLQDCPAGKDQVLIRAACFGVGFHHAGLTIDERNIIENGFRSNVLRILVATSTLSSGVNLPARRVIIRTPIFHGEPIEPQVYRQMIGRAGRTGQDSQGESFLLCTKAQKRQMEHVATTGLQPVNSCLGQTRGCLNRAILEVIASGIVSTPEQLDTFTKLTFYSASRDCVKEPLPDVISQLLEQELIRQQRGDGQQMRYVGTALGQACLAASIHPREGMELFAELQKARQAFVLENDLHVIYQVTPYSIAAQMTTLDKIQMGKLWYSMSPDMRRVGQLVGITDAMISRVMQGQAIEKENTDRMQRYFTALALLYLIEERPLASVANLFRCPRGLLQSLQINAAMYAGMVSAFCHKLGWTSLQLLVEEVQPRLEFGIQRDLIDLLRVDMLNASRARALFNKGFETVADLAAAQPMEVEQALTSAMPFESEKEKSGESSHEAEKRNRVKLVWMTGRDGLTGEEAAVLLVAKARQLIQEELAEANNRLNSVNIPIPSLRTPVRQEAKMSTTTTKDEANTPDIASPTNPLVVASMVQTTSLSTSNCLITSKICTPISGTSNVASNRSTREMEHLQGSTATWENSESARQILILLPKQLQNTSILYNSVSNQLESLSTSKKFESPSKRSVVSSNLVESPAIIGEHKRLSLPLVNSFSCSTPTNGLAAMSPGSFCDVSQNIYDEVKNNFNSRLQNEADHSASIKRISDNDKGDTVASGMTSDSVESRVTVRDEVIGRIRPAEVDEFSVRTRHSLDMFANEDDSVEVYQMEKPKIATNQNTEVTLLTNRTEVSNKETSKTTHSSIPDNYFKESLVFNTQLNDVLGLNSKTVICQDHSDTDLINENENISPSSKNTHIVSNSEILANNSTVYSFNKSTPLNDDSLFSESFAVDTQLVVALGGTNKTTRDVTSKFSPNCEVKVCDSKNISEASQRFDESSGVEKPSVIVTVNDNSLFNESLVLDTQLDLVLNAPTNHELPLVKTFNSKQGILLCNPVRSLNVTLPSNQGVKLNFVIPTSDEMITEKSPQFMKQNVNSKTTICNLPLDEDNGKIVTTSILSQPSKTRYLLSKENIAANIIENPLASLHVSKDDMRSDCIADRNISSDDMIFDTPPTQADITRCRRVTKSVNNKRRRISSTDDGNCVKKRSKPAAVDSPEKREEEIVTNQDYSVTESFLDVEFNTFCSFSGESQNLNANGKTSFPSCVNIISESNVNRKSNEAASLLSTSQAIRSAHKLQGRLISKGSFHTAGVVENVESKREIVEIGNKQSSMLEQKSLCVNRDKAVLIKRKLDRDAIDLTLNSDEDVIDNSVDEDIINNSVHDELSVLAAKRVTQRQAKYESGKPISSSKKDHENVSLNSRNRKNSKLPASNVITKSKGTTERNFLLDDTFETAINHVGNMTAVINEAMKQCGTNTTTTQMASFPPISDPIIELTARHLVNTKKLPVSPSAHKKVVKNVSTVRSSAVLSTNSGVKNATKQVSTSPIDEEQPSILSMNNVKNTMTEDKNLTRRIIGCVNLADFSSNVKLINIAPNRDVSVSGMNQAELQPTIPQTSCASPSDRRAQNSAKLKRRHCGGDEEEEKHPRSARKSVVTLAAKDTRRVPPPGIVKTILSAVKVERRLPPAGLIADTSTKISMAVALERNLDRSSNVGIGGAILGLKSPDVEDEESRVSGVALCFGGMEVYYIPLPDCDQAIPFLTSLLSSERTLLMCNAEQQIKLLRTRLHVDTSCRISDPLVASWLLNHEKTDLFALSQRIEQPTTLCHLIKNVKHSYVAAEKKLHVTDWCNALMESSGMSGCVRASSEAICTWHVTEKLTIDLESCGMLNVYTDVEMPVLAVLARMDCTGLCVDQRVCSQLRLQHDATLAQVDKVGMVDKKRILNACTQLRQALGAVGHRRKVHTTSNVLTATGRIMTSNPDVQCFPRESEMLHGTVSIRQAFVSPPGQLLVSADYSQLELRMLAHLSDDANLRRVVSSKTDVFKVLASTWLDVDIHLVTPQQRSTAKETAYGMIYGMQSKSLAAKLDVDEQAAAKVMSEFNAKFPAVALYLQDVVTRCKVDGYVETVLGRRRYLPDISSVRNEKRAYSERQAVNTTIQGSAADMFKSAILRVDSCLRDTGQLVLHMHDELIYQVDAEHVNAAAAIIKEGMENAMALSVPFPVQVKSGKSWADLKPLEI